jgi:hypothetical protein
LNAGALLLRLRPVQSLLHILLVVCKHVFGQRARHGGLQRSIVQIIGPTTKHAQQRDVLRGCRCECCRAPEITVIAIYKQ